MTPRPPLPDQQRVRDDLARVIAQAFYCDPLDPGEMDPDDLTEALRGGRVAADATLDHLRASGLLGDMQASPHAASLRNGRCQCAAGCSSRSSDYLGDLCDQCEANRCDIAPTNTPAASS
jgi:hypothetical protein